MLLHRNVESLMNSEAGSEPEIILDKKQIQPIYALELLKLILEKHLKSLHVEWLTFWPPRILNSNYFLTFWQWI